MVLVTLAITTTRPPAADAQDLDVIATLTGECVAAQAVFHVEMVNLRDTTFNFEYQLAFGDIGLANQIGETSVAAGETFTFDLESEAVARPQWRVYISDIDQG